MIDGENGVDLNRIIRILCTGSRKWTDMEIIMRAVEDAAQPVLRDGNLPLFVHGDCPTGADNMVERYCTKLGGYMTERHPADWSKGKSAGPARNQHMVDLGAELCIGFPTQCEGDRLTCVRYPHMSHGTQNCLETAKAAFISLKIYHPNGSAYFHPAPERLI